MRKRRFFHQFLALFLALNLSLPGSAVALRQTGLEESEPTRKELVSALIGTPHRSGAEETYSDPGLLLREFLSREPPLSISLEEAVASLAREGRLVNSEGAPLSENQQLSFLFPSKALDSFFASLPTGTARTLEALQAQLRAAPAEKGSWDSFSFLRWLLGDPAPASLTVVQRVYLYQITDPGLRGADRSALMAASVVDNLGRPLGSLETVANRKALSYATHRVVRIGLNSLARQYRGSLSVEEAPTQLGLARVFLEAAVGGGGQLPKIRGREEGLAPATLFKYLRVLSNQYFRRWLAAWWVEDFLQRAGSLLEQEYGPRAPLISGYLEKALQQFQPEDVPDPRPVELGKVPAGIELLLQARVQWLQANPAVERSGSADPLAALFQELVDQEETEQFYRQQGYRIVQIVRDEEDPMRDPIPQELMLLALSQAISSGQDLFAVNVTHDLALRGLTFDQVRAQLTDLYA